MICHGSESPQLANCSLKGFDTCAVVSSLGMGTSEIEGSSSRAVQIPNLLIHDHGPRVGCGCLHGPASELRQEALQRSDASTKRAIFRIASL